MTRTTRFRALTLSLAAMTLVALAGCSEGASTATSGTQNPAIDTTAVKAVIDQAQAAPSFSPPGPAFDASKAKGKVVANISLNSTVPFNQIVDAAMGDAGKAAGVKVVQFTNQGQVSQWIQGMDSAIAQKVDAIVLEGSPDPKLLGPQIAAAKAAGIPVISTHLYDESYIGSAKKDLPDVTAFVDAHHYRAGTLMADYAIAQSGGHVNAYFVASNEVQPSAGIASAFSDELKARCPDSCKAKVVNIPISNWATDVPTQVQAALLSDPTINYVVPVFDGMTPLLGTGITQAGKTDSVKIVAYNGTASVLSMIQAKNLVAAEIGEPLEWLGWANMDQVLRVLTGTAPLASEKTPLRLFDANNVNETGTPANQKDGYGDPAKFQDGYKTLWGVK
ncbi:sugar ABC transporter substrate-binding protein [Arthrobacter sp. FW306-04-A]|uniref:sugar ABC transporter substrate-binding protein n=1 Tax=Arthrobacter sp. FW306-04-A TaxID=2879619 RepID=UPI0037C1A8ED|nr:sugar ABC transporter substrate-binding protein [Arthrobacter sp. FW306-04-A]